MKKALITLILIMSTFMVKGASDKEAQVQAVLNRMQLLARLADQEAARVGEKDFKNDVEKKVAPLLTSLQPEELGKMAVMSMALYFPGDAADVGYDTVYYAAFWGCVDLLCKNADKESHDALLFIRAYSHLTGGEKLQFDYVFGEFEKKTKGKF